MKSPNWIRVQDSVVSWLIQVDCRFTHWRFHG